MNAKVKIHGDVGVAVSAVEGTAINIYLASNGDNSSNPINLAVHLLLKTCDEANCRPAMERISQTLFGSAIFKSLNLEQLKTLQTIAGEMSAAMKTGTESHSAFTREMDEYEDFYKRTGMRASKPERTALTALMTNLPFTSKQIKSAWNKGVLIYKDNRLNVDLPRFEPVLGAVLTLLCGLELILIMMQIILTKPPLTQLAEYSLLLVLFVAALIVSTDYLIAPAFIGRRIKAALALMEPITLTTSEGN